MSGIRSRAEGGIRRPGPALLGRVAAACARLAGLFRPAARSLRLLPGLVAAGILLGPGATGAAAQDVVVLGTVVDGDTGDGVPQALVRILRPRAEGPARLVQELETDADGAFTTEPLPPGPHRVRVEMVGYRTLEEAFRVEGRSPMLLGVRLVPEAVELEPVVVSSVRSAWLEQVGFYQRARRNPGAFLDRTDIELRDPLRASDLVRRVSGVTLREPGGVSAPVVTMRQGCLADLVVDGQNLGRGEPPDRYVSPGDIEAVEIHKGLTTPQEYSQSTCGAVLIWTRDPGELGEREFELGRTLRILGIFGAVLWFLAR